MLGLVAAQLNYKAANKELVPGKAVWVDVSVSDYHCEIMLTA